MTVQALFWLPVDVPPKAVTLVVTCRDDDASTVSELTQRGYSVTKMAPLTKQQQKDFCVVSSYTCVLVSF